MKVLFCGNADVNDFRWGFNERVRDHTVHTAGHKTVKVFACLSALRYEDIEEIDALFKSKLVGSG